VPNINRYGLLRAPWNNNPSPYVSRYPSAKQEVHLPSCTELRTFALGSTKNGKEGGDWTATAWMYGASNKPHGNMHAGPGGTVTLNMNALMPPLVGAAIAASVREHTLWRFRVIDFPAECDPTAAPADCRATCNFDLWSKEEVRGQFRPLCVLLLVIAVGAGGGWCCCCTADHTLVRFSSSVPFVLSFLELVYVQ